MSDALKVFLAFLASFAVWGIMTIFFIKEIKDENRDKKN